MIIFCFHFINLPSNDIDVNGIFFFVESDRELRHNIIKSLKHRVAYSQGQTMFPCVQACIFFFIGFLTSGLSHTHTLALHYKVLPVGFHIGGW